MKKVILLIAFVLIVSVGFAGPFGLEMGMTLDEIKEKCDSSNVVKNENEGDMYFIKPPKPSPFFPYYPAFVDGTVGLYCIQGLGMINSYETCLISLGNLANRLRNYYGEPQRITKLKDSTPVYMNFNPDVIIQYWWELPQCKKLEKEKIAYVVLCIKEVSKDGGFVEIDYVFNNYKKVVENATPF